MSDSEVMTIIVLFRTMRHCDLKSFYLSYICSHMRRESPHCLSYNRFVERQAKAGFHLLLFLQTCALGKCTGKSIIDSTPLVACHIKRALSHKTMKGCQGQEHYGMVLWFQAAHCHKRPRRNRPVDTDTRKHGRPRTAERQGLHTKALWKDIRRQGIHKPRTFRIPFCR